MGGDSKHRSVLSIKLIQYENQYKSKYKKNHTFANFDVCIEYDTLKCLVSLSELGIEKKERKRGSLFLQE